MVFKKKLLVFLFLLVVLPLTVLLVRQRALYQKKAVETNQPEQPQPEYVPGEILVKFKLPSEKLKIQEEREIALVEIEAVPPEAQALVNFLKENKIEKMEKIFKGAQPPRPGEKFDFSSNFKLKFDEKINVEEQVEKFIISGLFEYAEPNYIYSIDAIPEDPNDPYFRDSYPDHTENRDPNWNPPHDYQWNIKKTNSSSNWLIDASQIIVAVIDTGVDVNHPDLGNVWINEDEIPGDNIDNDQNGYIDDVYGCNAIWSPDGMFDDNNHGTHVAGVISVKTNNNIGLAGITNNAKIMAVKVMDADGIGLASNIAQGIRYAADNSAHIINMSLGGLHSSTMEEALDYATSLDIISVISAGNGNSYSVEHFPASYKSAITVGGVDENLNKLRYANYGPNIDVAAPAGGAPCLYFSKPSYCSNILSLKSSQNQEDQEFIVNEQYLLMSGTSMAAPHVAGVIALLLAQHPEFTLADIENYIRFNSIDLTGLGHTEQLGWGVINSKGSDFVVPSDIDFEIVHPAEKALVGREFVVRGTISALNFDYYKVEYKKEGDDQWLKEGISLVNNGRQTVVSNNHTLGEIATILLPENSPRGVYLIKISLFMTNGRSINATKRVHFLQKPGTSWLDVSGQSEPFLPGGNILIADLDDNRNQEIILYNYGPYDHKKLSVFDNSYNLLWEIFQEGEVVIGDIDRRFPGKELILQTKDDNIYSVDENIFVYDNQGNKINDLTISYEDTSRGFTPNLLITDADQNGIDELYFYQERYSQKKLRVFEQSVDSQFREKWTLDTGDANNSYAWPVAGDLNGDGKKEIVIFQDSSLVVVNHHGQEVARGDYLASKIALGDINGDSKEEIIIAGPTKALQLNGNTVVEMWTYNHGAPVDSLTLADFNNDGLPDIHAQVSNIRQDIVFDYNGTILFEGRAPLYFSNSVLNKGIILIDRDSNHKIELYQSGLKGLDHRGYLNVQEFDFETGEGVFIDGEWKVLSDNYQEGAIAASDIDGNGRIELIIVGVGIIEYETQGLAYWPHRYHDFQRTGSFNFSPSVVISPTLTPTPTPIGCSPKPAPDPCSGFTLCGAADCWRVESKDEEWPSCFQYDYDGDCDVDVVDIQKCASKCRSDGKVGACCSLVDQCSSGLNCQQCYQSLGECRPGPSLDLKGILKDYGQAIQGPGSETAASDLNADSLINGLDFSAVYRTY